MTQPARLSAPFTAESALQSVKEWSRFLKVGTVTQDQSGLKFALVPPGEYTRGTSAKEADKIFAIHTKFNRNYATDERELYNFLSDRFQPHRVVISTPMFVSRYEVTFAQYALVMNEPLRVEKELRQLPVQQVSWYDAIAFCNALSAREKLSPYYHFKLISHGQDDSISEAEVSIKGGDGYRLLTEAEWEYACRAGTETLWHFGDFPDSTKAHILPDGVLLNPRQTPVAVGSYPPNAFGLHDMHGNVQEWCFDLWPREADYARYRGGPVSDPVILAGGDERICRGRDFHCDVQSRSGDRNSYQPDEPAAGIRVCRTIPVPAE